MAKIEHEGNKEDWKTAKVTFENFRALNSFYYEYQKQVADFSNLAPLRQSMTVDFPAHFIESVKRKPFHQKNKKHFEDNVLAV